MIGLYGGVFDPPHRGHVALAAAALDAFDLEQLRVLVVVAPGHKRAVAPPDARLRLAEAAFVDVPRTAVEPERYARTVDALERRGPGDTVFLIGADEWRDFAAWKDPERVLELTTLGVATRPGYEIEIPKRWAGRVLPFQIDAVPVSSSDVRARVRRGESVRELVPSRVAELIDELRLYRAG